MGIGPSNYTHVSGDRVSTHTGRVQLGRSVEGPEQSCAMDQFNGRALRHGGSLCHPRTLDQSMDTYHALAFVQYDRDCHVRGRTRGTLVSHSARAASTLVRTGTGRVAFWIAVVTAVTALAVLGHVDASLVGSESCMGLVGWILHNGTCLQDDYKKTDGDTDPSEPRPRAFNARRRRQQQTTSPIWSRIIQWFALSYALYNFAGERQWIRKHDNGDIGEALRLSQYWVMYSSVAETAHTTQLTGILQQSDDDDTKDRRMDLLEYIRTGQVQPALSAETVPLDMSRRYPSARWERAVHTWASKSYLDPKFGQERGAQLCRALCALVARDDRAMSWNRQLEAIELRFQHSYILPPGSPTRYAAQWIVPDTVVTVPCNASRASPSTVGDVAA